MARRHFNWKLLIVLVIAVAILGVTAFALRKWQRSHRAYTGLELGNKAYDKGAWEEAAKNLGRYLAVERDDVPALLKYADAQLNIRPLKRNNVQQAIAAYRTVLRVAKNNSEAAERLVEMYLGMNMPDEAELIAKRQLGRDSILQDAHKTGTGTSQDPKLRRMLAVALAKQRKFTEAAAELKAIIIEHPEQVLAYETLGQLAEQRQENFPEPPSYWLNEAVKNNPSSALAYIIRANFHLRSKDTLKALADLEQAEKQDLSDSVVQLRLATELIKANLLDNAEKHLVAVQNAAPTNQTLWQIWAQLALKSGSKTKMLKVAEIGLTKLSTQPWDFMPIATELFILSNQLDQAADCISKLRQKDITPETTAFLEGLLADRKGQSYNAVKCWHRAMQLGNESPQIRLTLASTLSGLGDTQSALHQLRVLVSERPDLLNGHLSLAKLLAQTGSWAEAAEHARKATGLSPENVEAALLYSQARMQLLAANSTGNDIDLWQDVEKQLSALEQTANAITPVQLLRVELAMHRKDFAKAEELLIELKKDRRLRVKVVLAEAELLTAQGRTDEAVLTLNKAVEELPDVIELVEYYAILLARQGKREKCENIIKDTLARITKPVSQQRLGLLLAELYNRGGQEEKAYKLLSSLAEKLPTDVFIKRRLLRCQQVLKSSMQAQKLIDDIKDLEGENGWQWRYEQARLWFSQNDFKNRYSQIVSLLHENMVSNPDDQASRMLLASAYEQAGELQLAISTYRDVLNRSPQDLSIIIPTVAALYKAKEYDQADEILDRAVRAKLHHPELSKLQLQSYLRRRHLAPASEILEDLLDSNPENWAMSLSLALLKIRQNKFSEAAELLAELKTRHPSSLPVTAAQIQLNIRQDKQQEALKLCDEIVNNLNSASAYIFRARTYAMLGRTKMATEDFEHATTAEPTNVETWMAKSDFHRSQGQPDKAAADIQQALSLAPDNLQTQKRAVSLFLTSRNIDRINQARSILDKALQANPEDTELRLYQARSLLTEATAPAIAKATGILRKITEDQPEMADAWVLLGGLSLGQGQFGKAMDIALQGLVHSPNDKEMLLLKARAEAGRLPALAIPTLKVLLELYPDDADVVLQLANTYIVTGEYNKASDFLRKQLESCDTRDLRRLNIDLAVALYKSGNRSEAEREFDLLIQSAPDDPAPLLALARLLKEEQQWLELMARVTDWHQRHVEDTYTLITVANDLATTDNQKARQTAESIFRVVLDSDPQSTQAMISLGMLLQIMGRSVESAQLYRQILQIEPNNVITINNLAWILCEEQDKYQQALELAQRGLKIAPNYIDLIDTRGAVYCKLGQYDKAIQDFTKCLKLYPDRTPSAVASYFHLGKAFVSLEQKTEAVENLKKALELNTKIGGLSGADLAEARRLLEALSQGV